MLELVRCRILDQGRRTVFAAGSLWRESSLQRAQGRGAQNQHCDGGQMFSFSPNLIVQGGMKFCECKDWENLQIQLHIASSPEASHGGQSPSNVQVQLRVYGPREESPWRGAHGCKRCGKCLNPAPDGPQRREALCLPGARRAFRRSSSFFQHHRLHGGEALLVSDVPRCL